MRFVIDIESTNLLQNGLDYTRMPYRLKPDYTVHCIVIRHVDSPAVKTLVGEEITKENLRNALRKCTELIGHNIVAFDLPVLMLYGVLDYEIGYPGKPTTVFGQPCKITDTLLWSKLLNADRFGGHSLEAWGKRLGNAKTDFKDWSKFSQEMLDYCVQDTAVNADIFRALLNEQGDHDWSQPYSMEVKLADLTLRQELFGFAFDSELANANIAELTEMMQQIALKVDPLLPKKKMTKGDASYFIPPKIKFKKNGEVSSNFQKFLEKLGATLSADTQFILYEGKQFPVATEDPLKDEETASIEDIDVVKAYLLSLGWKPSEVKERDITRNQDKSTKKLPEILEAVERYIKQTEGSLFKDLRLEHMGIEEKNLRKHLMKLVEEAKPQIKFDKMQAQKPIFLPTTPKLTVGVEKEICPNLIELGDKAAFVKDVVHYYTYRHRKNSIAGGVLDEDGAPVTGFLSAVREDGRIPTPADTLGANTGRYRHRLVCNVPRVTSLYGENMRNLFGCGKGLYQLGFDFASLEARIMGHYVIPFKYGAELAESLVAEKPQDLHSVNSRKLGIDRNSAKSFSYACLPMQTKVLTATGWKLYGELKEGDSLPTFNEETGKVEMDTILMKHFFKDKEVVKFSNKRSSFECTEDHRWYGWRRSKTKRKPSSKKFGWFQAKEFTQEHNLILTAPYVGGNSTVTPDEAKLMGYILSDGCYAWSKLSEATSCAGGRRKGVALSLCQSINKFVEEIEELLAKNNLKYLKSFFEKENGNHVYGYSVSSPDAREFLDRVVGTRQNKHDVNWVEWVLSLSRESLEAFYEGFYNGDGRVTGTAETITQNIGNVHEAVVAAAQLLGKGRISITNKSPAPNARCQDIRVQKRKHMTMQEQEKTKLGVQDTFCLTTKNGSFIIWQDSFVGITGNCIYGSQPKKLAKMLNVTEERSKELFNAYWEAVPALKELKQTVEKEWETRGKKSILGLDGRLLNTRSKHSLINVLFQSGGAIAAKWSSVKIAEYLEERDLLGDPFKHTKKDKKVWFMIAYHDECQFAVHPQLMKVQVFASEEEAKDFIKQNEGCSAVGHGAKGPYAGLKTTPVEAIEVGISEANKHLGLNVQLGFEWIPGLTWGQCH